MKLTRTEITKIFFSISAILLIVVRAKYQKLIPSDVVTIGLIIAAGLPWVANFLDAAELPGGWKFKFQQIAANQLRQEDEIRSLKFLITYFVSDREHEYLKTILDPTKDFPVNKKDEYYDQLLDELRRLRALNLIEQIDKNKGFRAMAQIDDLKDFFKITERGHTYLNLRHQWGQQVN